MLKEYPAEQSRLYGHFFTLLQNRNIPIETFITKIDESCQFKVLKKVEHLILLRHDLLGNYKGEGKLENEIFKDVEFYVNDHINSC